MNDTGLITLIVGAFTGFSIGVILSGAYEPLVSSDFVDAANDGSLSSSIVCDEIISDLDAINERLIELEVTLDPDLCARAVTVSPKSSP